MFKNMPVIIVILLCSVLTINGFSNIVSKLTSTKNSISDTKENSRKEIYSEDGALNFTELAWKYIGIGEEYDIVTEDGYILKLFHIPGNPTKTVLLSPGVLVTPDNYLIRGYTSLIYMMAKEGFDIWAMNYRGTRYSRRHVKLDPDIGAQYWQYSMHEIGIYDYKAIIDFILEYTGQEQLSVVAHSEGTSAFFVLTSERPEYNNKVKVFTALAPVCYLRHIGPTLTGIIKAEKIIKNFFRTFGIEELFGYYSFEKKLIDVVCSQGIAGYEKCFNIIGSVTGFSSKNIEPEFTTTVLGHFPAGSSLKNLLHYVHIYQQDNFVKYDYGLDNIRRYGSIKPPAYDLKKVTTNVALFVAKSDILATVQDVERLRSVLPNIVYHHVVQDESFNHIDYMWAKHAHEVLYPYVIDVLLRYS